MDSVIPTHVGIQLKRTLHNTNLLKWIPAFAGIILLVFLVIPNVLAAPSLDQVNQKVCDRFQVDINRLGAIMDEYRSRQGITQTRVAYGQVDTPVEQADYWVNYAAEALAYQRAQKYSSVANLRSSLGVLAGKILKAKTAVGQVIK